ncbi:MAG: glycerophosphodiester phosphodiesterase family protein [Pseudomonadota bacterium]
MRLDPGFYARPFAHRALHGPGAPENSREAIAAAVAGGWGIEIDVQATEDGAPFVFHDYGLERLTGRKGTVQTTRAADMATIPLLGGPTAAPTLTEVLDMVAGQVPLLIEIKDQDGALGTKIGGLQDAVASALDGYDGPVALMSFNPHAALALRPTGRPIGITSCNYVAEDWPTIPAATRRDLAEIPHLDQVDFLSHQWDELDSPAVARAKSAGKPVFCWTIRDQAQADTARQVADQITFEGFYPGLTACAP